MDRLSYQCAPLGERSNLSIVIKLGLEKCFHKVKVSLEDVENMSQEIKLEIEDAIEEVVDNISNPSFNLEK